MTDYAKGEIAALIGPILKLPNDEIEHWGIIATTENGMLKVVACSHLAEVLNDALVTNGYVHSSAYHVRDFGKASGHPRKGWVDRFMSFMRF